MPNDFVSVIQPTAAKNEGSGEGTGGKRPLPVLPVRDTVLFPHAVLPLTVGRESSIQLIQSLGEEKTILVVAQRDARQDSPQAADLYAIGTRATVHKVVKMPNQSLFVFTEGNERVRLGDFAQLTPFMTAENEVIPDVEPAQTPEAEALQRNVVSQFQQIVTSSPTLSDDLQTIAINIEVSDDDGQAGAAGDAGCFGAAGAHQQAPGEGAGGSAASEQDPERGARLGAAVAAGLLPARADEGDPERAGRSR